MKTRTIKKVYESVSVMEGAGVRLNRVFGYYETPNFDPFLLLDHFQSENPKDFMSGFPWHPHRGIETVTYMLKGQIEHSDSLGNKGVIKAGDVQWMTAGSGIIHQEMPYNGEGINGFQLWVNLPAKDKMMGPKYQEIKKDEIPETQIENNRIKVICGDVKGTRGPVKGIPADPTYLDVHIPAHQQLNFPTPLDWNVFAYVYEGLAQFEKGEIVNDKNVVLFGEGEQVRILAGESPVSCLLVAAIPLNQPIAWRGPIVMNNEAEIKMAFHEYHNGTFIK